jgi:hypothetical protein
MLLFVDSFDHYATADIALKWSAVSSATQVTIAPTAGRRGGGALSLTGNINTVRKDLVGVKTVIVGYAMKITAFPTAGGTIGTNYWMSLGNADGVHLYFLVGADGSIAVHRLTSVNPSYQLLGSTTGAVLQPNVYAYIEVKATISATGVGMVKILVNGVTVLSLPNITTISYASTNEVTSRLTFNTPILSGPTLFFDDLYICDTSGTVNNDFFGDVRIDVVKPNADGTYRDFVPDTGTAHFSRVNEAVADQLSFVAASTVGAKDSYQFEDLAGIVGTVRGVQIVDAAVKDDAGPRSVSHLAKSGISEEYSAPIPLSTDRKLYTTIHERDPATGGNWTQTSLNAAEFGIVVAA